MLEVVMIFESVQFSKNQVWLITLYFGTHLRLLICPAMGYKTFAAAKVRNNFDICKKREIFLRKNVEWLTVDRLRRG